MSNGFETIYYGSLNPLGLRSLAAAAVCAAVWLMTELKTSRCKRLQAWMIVTLPLMLLAYCYRVVWLYYIFGHFNRNPPDFEAQDFMAGFVFVAVALLFSWKAIRLPFKDLAVLGIIDALFSLAGLGGALLVIYEYGV